MQYKDYEASDRYSQRVYRRKSANAAQKIAQIWRKVNVGRHDECWEYTGKLSAHGYPPMRGHRLAYQSVHGPIPHGMMVMHMCDNPKCCNPGHLLLGTAKDNFDDMVNKGRCKLTPYQ